MLHPINTANRYEAHAKKHKEMLRTGPNIPQNQPLSPVTPLVTFKPTPDWYKSGGYSHSLNVSCKRASAEMNRPPFLTTLFPPFRLAAPA